MSGWTLVETHPNYGRTFQRPLDPMEAGYVLSGHMNGTTDNIHHAVLRLANGCRDLHLFSEANIVKAWLSTKRRHPLAGATIKRQQGDDGPPSQHYFVVRENDLSVLHPNEVVFEQVASHEEALKRITAIWDGPRPLSDELLVKLFILRETNPDRADLLHVALLRSHCMTDGTADRTFMRCLFDSLARGGDPDSEPAQVPLEERLAMLIPTPDLEPAHLRSASLARRRWRKAVGAILFQKMMKDFQGGHTLPCRVTRVTPVTPARPGFIYTLLAPEETSTILANSRKHELTFGNAYFAVTQVAMTRVLYRRYSRGEISKEEWVYRQKQPYHIAGPFRLRPYLDKSWYEKGGGGEFILSISLFYYRLPFITLGRKNPWEYQEEELSDGAPPYSDFTFNRFLYRAQLIQKQAKAFFGHPLFYEIACSLQKVYFRNALLSEEKIEARKAVQNPDEEAPLPVTDIHPVLAHIGSSLGNMDQLLPMEYPVSLNHSLSPFSSVPSPLRTGYPTPPPADQVDAITNPTIVVESSMTRLYPRPAQIYFGAVTLGGRLNLHCFYDRNVYEDEIVKEWVHEVKQAALWYLGRTHVRD